MALTYHYYKEGYALPMNFTGQAILSRTVDMPAIIASGLLGYSPLAVLGLRTAVPATGMAVGDTFQLFRVPAGTMLRSVGMRVTTINTLACTVAIGNASTTQTHLLGANTAGYKAATSLASAVTTITAVGDAHAGSDFYEGVVFVTTGTIDLLLAAQTWIQGICTFWADVVKVF